MATPGLEQLAVAGFDLGAYTAMTVAGERVRHAENAAGRVRFAPPLH